MSARNISRIIALGSIPAAYVIALHPVAVRSSVVAKSKKGLGESDPRGRVAAILDGRDTSLSAEDVALVSRANGAHYNNLEAFPLYAASVLAASAAKVPWSTIRNAALVYLSARIAYNVAFMHFTSEASPGARGIPFATSHLTSLFLFAKAILSNSADV